MSNWNILEEKFLNRFFPHNKFVEDEQTIVVFFQGSTKILCKAWERYKSILKRCPNYSDDVTQIHISEMDYNIIQSFG